MEFCVGESTSIPDGIGWNWMDRIGCAARKIVKKSLQDALKVSPRPLGTYSGLIFMGYVPRVKISEHTLVSPSRLKLCRWGPPI